MRGFGLELQPYISQSRVWYLYKILYTYFNLSRREERMRCLAGLFRLGAQHSCRRSADRISEGGSVKYI